MSNSITTRETDCRYCERYQRACGRAHTADTRADWTRDWQGRSDRATLYRAEGDAEQTGYAGTIDERTGRYFGSLRRALTHCHSARHLYEIDLSAAETWTALGDPDDHVLVSAEQAARKTHSALCPCHWHDTSDETLGSCGCTDYHVADCPLRTAAHDLSSADDWDPYGDTR